MQATRDNGPNDVADGDDALAPAKQRHCWLRARETRSASSTRAPRF